jgi:quinol monooxygenase YgiN
LKIITAQVTVRAEHWGAAQQLAEEHSRASRQEAGCLSHDWYAHPTAERTLFFFEQWRDQAAIDEHFAKPYSALLVASFQRWAESPLELRILDVSDFEARSIPGPD